MDDKDELFVEGREGEEDLLDFEFEEMPEEILEVEEDTSLDEEIVELTKIIQPGDVGAFSETGEPEAGDKLDDSVDLKDAFSEESRLEDLEDISTLKEDESVGKFDADFDAAFGEAETSERMASGAAGGISTADDKEIQFYGNLDDIPDIDDGAVIEIKPEEIPGIDEKGGQEIESGDIPGLDTIDTDLDEIDRDVQDKLEPEPQPEDIDLGAMIDELEREEIGLESEELELEPEEDHLEDVPGIPLDDSGQLSQSSEIGLESGDQEVSEPEPLEPETLEPETLEPEKAEPESLEFEALESLEPEIFEPDTMESEPPERIVIDSKTEDSLAGLSEEKIQQMITGIVKNVVEKAVKESMSGTAEKVIRETIDALKATIESSEE